MSAISGYDSLIKKKIFIVLKDGREVNYKLCFEDVFEELNMPVSY